VTLSDVLTKPQFREALRSFLREIGNTTPLDFLDDVDNFRHCVAGVGLAVGGGSGGGGGGGGGGGASPRAVGGGAAAAPSAAAVLLVPPPKSPRNSLLSAVGGAASPEGGSGRKSPRGSRSAPGGARLSAEELSAMARNVFNTFLAAGAKPRVEVDAATVQKISLQLAQADSRRAPSAALFDEAAHEVRKEIESELFPRFMQSDAYIDMMVARLGTGDANDKDMFDPESEDEAKEAQIAHSATLTRMDGGPLPEGAWRNDANLQSLHVDVVGGRSLRQGFLGSQPSAYCVVTVGSTSYRTPSVSGQDPQWSAQGGAKNHFEFPLKITLQSVIINVFDSQLMRPDKHLGSVKISLSSVLRAQREEHAARGGKEGDELPEDVAPRWFEIKKPVDAEAGAPKARGELQLRVFMSRREAANPGAHRPIVLETSSVIADVIRKQVSKKKRRFVEDGFDLDLSYITDRIIAMGFPSQSVEGLYRNSMAIIKKFFDTRHPAHYKVYNLCSERRYDAAYFEGRVALYPFDDHNPCAFDMIEPFCRDVHSWLSEHPQHIAAIHCKAGKGRTGLLIACYLLYTNLFPNALSALKFYAARRTKNRKGVTIPSQIRYVSYFERFLKYERLLERNVSRLQSLSSADLAEVVRAGVGAAAGAGAAAWGGGSLSEKFRDEEAHEDEEKAQHEQQAAVAARVLGYHRRRLSIAQQADVLDYLSMRNNLRYSVDAAPPQQQQKQQPQQQQAAGNGNGDGEKKIPQRMGSDASLRASYFLPDDDKHHVFVTRIVLHTLPRSVKGDGEALSVEVHNGDLHLSTRALFKPRLDAAAQTLTFELPPKALHVYGDVQFELTAPKWSGGRVKLLQFWLHTRFVVASGCKVLLTKPELDKANKDTKHKKYEERFAIEVFMDVLPDFKKGLYSALDRIERGFENIDRSVRRSVESADSLASAASKR
jgi:hypothetical protein